MKYLGIFSDSNKHPSAQITPSVFNLSNNLLFRIYCYYSIDLERPFNDIVEEAFRDLLIKYQKITKE